MSVPSHFSEETNIYMRCKEMSQDFIFDKFMDDILLKEAEENHRKRKLETESETPQREYLRRYTERVGNRIRVGK